VTAKLVKLEAAAQTSWRRLVCDPMTRLGFLLESDSCIGCHACTVACKSEHDVPIGVNRTWVKYVESGSFPETDRHFSVMRCNQCDDAPCMAICPTSALFRAPNGVVDFNDDDCIGCKSCMNACPYDALYINPETNTAHKCNFCNHRIEVGLLPSCVVVCPTNAIKVADFDNPDDPVVREIARSDTAVRAPEQGTLPKVHYRGAHETTLDPKLSAISADGMIWADTTAAHPTVPVVGKPVPLPSGADLPDEVRTAYTTPHPMVWGWKVSAYLVTKSIAAGVMAVAALLVALGYGDVTAAVGVAPPMVAGVFLALTGLLLVVDLKQPLRFHYLLTRANRTSWLVKGSYFLLAFALICAAWWVAGLAEAETVLVVLTVPAVLLGAGVAGYTAMLFGQCEGRDLWQSHWVLPTLLAQAVTAGAASFTILDLGMDVPSPRTVQWTLLGGLAALALFIALETFTASERHVQMALSTLTRGRYRYQFWVGAVALGLVLPLVLVISQIAGDLDGSALPAVAGVAAVVGLVAYEDAFVRAGQSVPLS
jgi:Fe-S-cluster-containing dehydrogenase component/formate-dependent nitrite reductase membrane component NrfD